MSDLKCHYPCSTPLIPLHDDDGNTLICPKCHQWYRLVIYSGGTSSATKIETRAGTLPPGYNDVTFDPL